MGLEWGLALEAVDLALGLVLGLVLGLDLGLEWGLELDLALELLDPVLEQELGLVLGLEWSQEWGQEQRLDLDLLCLSTGPRTRLGLKLEARPGVGAGASRWVVDKPARARSSMSQQFWDQANDG